MANHISRQGFSLNLHSKGGIEKINSRDLTETGVIKSEIQITITMMNKIDQDQKGPLESLKKEVKSIRTKIINTPRI